MGKGTLWKAGAVILVIAIWGWASSRQQNDIPMESGHSEDDGHDHSQNASPQTAPPKTAPTQKTTNKGKIMDVKELKIEDEKIGDGAEAVTGKNVTVNYRGMLTDGTVFDESYKRGEPFSFDLGAGNVIKGWDKGVAGMKVGGKRKLTIPPDMGYGASGAGATIPPNATLIFEVELLKVN